MTTLPFWVDMAVHSALANYMHVGTDTEFLPHQSGLYNARLLYDPSSVLLFLSILGSNNSTTLSEQNTSRKQELVDSD